MIRFSLCEQNLILLAKLISLDSNPLLLKVTFINNQNAFSRFGNFSNTNDVMQSLLFVCVALEKYREQIFLLSFITIHQTFVWIYHVDMHV